MTTCQICARSIKLQPSRLITRHGYTKPWGQGRGETRPCSGSNHLPFEVSRNILGDEIKDVTGHLTDVTKRIEAASAETTPAIFLYSVPSRATGRSEPHSMEVTRETFTVIYAADAHLFRKYSVGRFDDVKAKHLDRLQVNLRQTQAYLARQQLRFDTWKVNPLAPR